MDDSNNGRSFGSMIRAKIRKENLALKWMLPDGFIFSPADFKWEVAYINC
jgi:hypothetical protein